MSSSKSESSCSSEDDNEVRRGPWTLEEDTLLTQYISSNGEGRWNLLAQRSGLKRTGKSCRLRWLNYLKPDVKRGNLTPQEQLVILELHSKWGNRWSKIAQHLPGRTDNEIKNYWRTRIQKQARHLKIDTSSREFKEIIRRFWMPKLLQKAREAPSPSVSSASSMSTIQNQTIPPLPLDSVPQYPQIIGTGQTQIPWQMQVPSRNESVQKSSCFSPESAANYVPKVSQILGLSDFSSYVYDDGNHVYDMDTCNVGNSVIMDEDHMGSNWVNNDVACSIWDMDELWQFNSLQD